MIHKIRYIKLFQAAIDVWKAVLEQKPQEKPSFEDEEMKEEFSQQTLSVHMI